MKLTVGPLPSGVYWRRRAIVGGVLLIVVLMSVAFCSGDDSDGKKKTSAGASAQPLTTGLAEPSTSLQVPTTGDPSAPADGAASTSATEPPPTVASTIPACADADLSLVAAPEQPVQFRGAYLKFTLKIKNMSARDCARDLGADFQELYLQVGASKIWSSDDCDPPRGHQSTTLKPSIEVAFSITWNGKTTSNGCVNRETPPAGKYQLVARLDTKLSEPVQVQLT